MISNEKEFYTVGFSQWGRWQVRKSSIDEPYKWSLVEDLGPSLLTVAIEADGQFTPPAHLNHFLFESEGLPWLAVITTDHKLYAKRVQAAFDTAWLVSEDVTAVSLCRGWRSDTWQVDAGLYCAYLKTNGDVCLRQLCLVQGQQTWTDEQLIAQNCTGVQAVRLNDYRMGIRVEPSHQLYVSDRYYIGGTARTEYVYEDMFCDFFVFSTPEESGPHDAFEVVNATVESEYVVKVEGNYPFWWRDENWMDVECLSNNTVTDYYIEDGFLYIVVENPISTALGYIRFKFRGFNRLRYERTPQSRPIVPELIFEILQPIDLPGETVQMRLSTAASFHETTPEHFKIQITEDVSMALTGAVSFHDVEVQIIDRTVTENVMMTLTGAFAFNEQQVGDVPV